MDAGSDIVNFLMTLPRTLHSWGPAPAIATAVADAGTARRASALALHQRQLRLLPSGDATLQDVDTLETRLFQPLGGDPEWLAQAVKAMPMGRLGTAREIANCIMWLISDDASYVTGTIIDAAGGRTTA